MQEITRPVKAEIDLANIRYQIKSIREQIGPESEIMAVVKADAYGHGAVKVARAALAAGARRLAVAIPEEAIQLRAVGIKAPIQVFGETVPEQVRLLVEYDLIPTICRSDSRKAINALAREYNKTIPVVLKVETGMNRLGLTPDKVPSFYQKTVAASNLTVDSLMTHFAKADEANKEYTEKQYERFQQAVTGIRELGVKDKDLPKLQVANSATIIDMPEKAHDIVRPGIMMYGLPPSQEVELPFTLRPVLSWKTRVAFLKKVPAGTPISYGGTYRTEREAMIATLPLGYADGYPRILSNQAEVLINGERAPIRGRVCMDMMMVEVTGIQNVEVGSEVTLIGSQGDEEITATELADLAKTINYEITCGISARVPRIYLNE
ncbi:MAG: alanine racemase [Bacillota bacterium]